MNWCKSSEPNPYPLRSEAGYCCGMCIRTPPEQRGTHKYFEAVRCYDDAHPIWAHMRFWRASRQWPPLAETIGEFYEAAASRTLDQQLQRTNQRHAKDFFKRAAKETPTPANLSRLAAQYEILASIANTPSAAEKYIGKARAIAAQIAQSTEESPNLA